jgi:hypothetical protein
MHTNCNTLGVDQVTQSVLHELRQVIRKVAVADVVKIVVVGVLSHPPVEVCPRQDVLGPPLDKLAMEQLNKPYHGILLVFNSLHSDLRQEIIMQHIRGEVGFDRQAFRQELLVELLPRLLTHENASAPVILKGPAGPAHHLEDLHDGIIDISVFPSFVVLNAHDYHHITGNGQTPSSFLLNINTSGHGESNENVPVKQS